MIAPNSGSVRVLYRDYGIRDMALASTDDGVTWTTPRSMGGERARHADLGAAGRTVAAAWDEARGIWISISQNLRAQWSSPRQVSTDGMVASHPLAVSIGTGFRLFWTGRDPAGLLHWRLKQLGSEQDRFTEIQ